MYTHACTDTLTRTSRTRFGSPYTHARTARAHRQTYTLVLHSYTCTGTGTRPSIHLHPHTYHAQAFTNSALIHTRAHPTRAFAHGRARTHTHSHDMHIHVCHGQHTYTQVHKTIPTPTTVRAPAPAPALNHMCVYDGQVPDDDGDCEEGKTPRIYQPTDMFPFLVRTRTRHVFVSCQHVCCVCMHVCVCADLPTIIPPTEPAPSNPQVQPDSFTQTVENIFDFSFLIKQGGASLSLGTACVRACVCSCVRACLCVSVLSSLEGAPYSSHTYSCTYSCTQTHTRTHTLMRTHVRARTRANPQSLHHISPAPTFTNATPRRAWVASNKFRKDP